MRPPRLFWTNLSSARKTRGTPSLPPSLPLSLRNVINGLGEIMKLALVRSLDLFHLLEAHGARLVDERFQGEDGVADRVIELSIQIMLEELGPNLWEERLER